MLATRLAPESGDVYALAAGGTRARVTTLASEDPDAENSVDEPGAVIPAASEAPAAGAEVRYTVRPYSLTVLRFPVR